MKAKLLKAINRSTNELCGDPQYQFIGTILEFVYKPRADACFIAKGTMTSGLLYSSPVERVSVSGDKWTVVTRNTIYYLEEKK